MLLQAKASICYVACPSSNCCHYNSLHEAYKPCFASGFFSKFSIFPSLHPCVTAHNIFDIMCDRQPTCRRQATNQALSRLWSRVCSWWQQGAESRCVRQRAEHSRQAAERYKPARFPSRSSKPCWSHLHWHTGCLHPAQVQVQQCLVCACTLCEQTLAGFKTHCGHRLSCGRQSSWVHHVADCPSTLKIKHSQHLVICHC